MASQGYLTEQGGLLKILYLGTRNTIEGLESAAFTKVNNTAAQVLLNPTVKDVRKLGCLAGSVAAVHGHGTTGAATGPQDAVVGIYVNDLAGNAYESSSAASSGKGVFVMGMGTYEVGVFETHNAAGNADIWASYVPGAKLFASANGLLTTSAGLAQPDPADVVIGIVTKGPTAADPIMRFNLRV
jgi:hypothetical protein